MQFNSGSLNLYYQQWLIDAPKAIIVIAHGLGEHSGRYEHVAKFFNDNSYSVYALDHRGHGQSDGAKGHVNNFSEYSDDLHNFIDLVKTNNPDMDIHLLGHSMGGLIATGYCLRYQDVKSVVITAPPYGVPGASNRIQLKIGAFLGKFLPETSLSNKIDPTVLCHSEKVVQAYVDDPLVHDIITLGWGRAYLAEQKFVSDNLQRLTLPSFLIIPQSDVVTDPLVSEAWFKRFPQGNKKLKCFPDSFHEVLNEESDGQEALQDIIAWLSTL